MTRRGLAARLLTTAALALVGAAAPSAAVPTEGPGATGCLHPDRADTPASARSTRGWQGRDHRALSTSERAEIAARTARVLAQRNASLDGRSRARRAPGSIPVYVHVMAAQDGTGNVLASRVAKQIEVLNAAFSGAESPGVAADSGFRFVLADIDRFTNTDWHKDRESTTYRARTRRGGAAALNVWLVGFNDLGIATFPWDYARNPRVDGVRVHYDSLPGNGIKNFDLGKSLVHEVGHWLGLYHTFEGGCTELNDEVADTPTQGAPTEGCPAAQDTCAQPGLDPVNNYMDYSYDACYSGFSPGQALRMQQMATAYRG